MTPHLERDVRALKLYALATTVLLLGLLLAGFTRQEKVDFDVLTVHRLNVVEADGSPALVISNRSLMPTGVVAGKEVPRQGGGKPGILFYNADGDESGGLTFDSQRTAAGHRADAALLFDQYRGDQTIGILYGEENGQRQAALKVWDHPLSMDAFMKKVDAMEKLPPGPKKEAARKEVRAAWGAQRVFLGKREDGEASLVLSDPKGRPRLRLSVGKDGAPAIELLDGKGKVVSRLPER